MEVELIKERVILAAQQVASVYGASVIFDKKNDVNEGRQRSLKAALYNLQDALKLLNGEKL